MNDGRLQTASWRGAKSSVLSQAGRLLSGIGILAVSPEISDAARKASRRDDDQDTKNDDRRDNDEDNRKQQDADQNDKKSDQDDKNTETNAENQDANDKNDNRERRENRDADDKNVKDESNGDENRSVTRRQDAEDSNDGESGRRSEEFAQNRNRNRDDEPADDTPAEDTPVTTPVAPSNPNVALDDVLDTSDADLVVEANPDVIASVSTSGGFAFARSGNVVAISGPDGARIIQSDDPDAVVTPSPTPDEPSDDGGNNDVEFTS